jgi:two-component sensor histidine kinase
MFKSERNLDIIHRVNNHDQNIPSLLGWQLTTTTQRFRERSVIFVRKMSNSHENIYFCEGGKNLSQKYIFVNVSYELL